MAKVLHHLEHERLRVLAPADKLIWAYLAEQGENEYSVRDLADRLGLVRATVQTGLANLRELGLVTVAAEGSGPHPPRLRAVVPS